jgi:hypothetical protein
MQIYQLNDAELDAVNGGWGYVNKSFNFQQNNSLQAAANVQAAVVNVPILSGQTNNQGVSQSNNIS